MFYNIGVAIFVLLSIYLVNANRTFFFESGKKFAGIWVTFLIAACCALSILTSPIWITGISMISVGMHLVSIVLFRPFAAELGNVMHSIWTMLCFCATAFNYYISVKYSIDYAPYLPIVASILMIASMIGSVYRLAPVFELEEPLLENLDVGEQVPLGQESFGGEIRYRGRN